MLWLTACFLLRTKDANYFGKANLCSVSSPFSYLDRFILIVFCYLSWLKVNLLWNKRSSFLGLLMPFFLILNSKDNLWSQQLWRSLSGFTCCIQGLGCCASLHGQKGWFFFISAYNIWSFNKLFYIFVFPNGSLWSSFVHGGKTEFWFL